MRSRKIKMLKGSSSSGISINENQELDSNVHAVDFLSSMPDNILVKIFSNLTMKEALYICISCKKLKRLWTVIPNVEFDETAHSCFSKKRNFVEVVSRFLDNHEGGIKKFRLSFSPDRYESEVLHWLSLVVKHGIEELDLVFGTQNTLVISIPDLAAKTVKVMNLRNCAVESPPVDAFKSLTSLLLGSVYISDDFMVLLFSEFQSLQHLNLEECLGFEQIEIVDPKSKLQTLILNDCEDLLRLNISHLKTLVIAKREMDFSFISDPQIGRLVLFREGHERITLQESEHMKANIINKLVNVEDLHLAGWAFKCFAAFPSVNNYQFAKLKILELDVYELKSLMELNQVVRQAEGLQLLLISIKEDAAEGYAIYGDRKFGGLIPQFLDNKDNADQNQALKVEINGFRGTDIEVSHIKYMLTQYPHLSVLKVNVAEGVDRDDICAYQLLIWRLQSAFADVKIILG